MYVIVFFVQNRLIRSHLLKLSHRHHPRGRRGRAPSGHRPTPCGGHSPHLRAHRICGPLLPHFHCHQHHGHLTSSVPALPQTFQYSHPRYRNPPSREFPTRGTISFRIYGNGQSFPSSRPPNTCPPITSMVHWYWTQPRGYRPRQRSFHPTRIRGTSCSAVYRQPTRR